MRAVATKTIEGSVTQETAFVMADDPLLVRAAGIEYRADRAASCLLRPTKGDEVLVALLPDRRAFVLAVLTRADGERTEIRVEGDLTLRSEQGRVDIASPAGVSVVTPEEITMVSGRLSLRAVATTLASEAVAVVGKTVTGEIDRVKLAAKSLDSVLDRFTQRVKRSIRMIEESDHVRAERIDYAAEKSVRLHAENTVITAKELVKVDGGQIHLG
jgi:hypothetical protein